MNIRDIKLNEMHGYDVFASNQLWRVGDWAVLYTTTNCGGEVRQLERRIYMADEMGQFAKTTPPTYSLMLGSADECRFEILQDLQKQCFMKGIDDIYQYDYKNIYQERGAK